MKFRFAYAGLLATVLLCCYVWAQTPAGKLTGKVKEKNGKALADVTVRVTSAKNKDDKRELKTGDKGEFTFDALPGGEYTVALEKTGFKSFNSRKLEITPGETLKLSRTIELEREGDPYAVIRGATLHGPGFSLTNATVTIERIDGGRKYKEQKLSQEGGEFSFRLRAEKAKYRITAEARGFQSTSTEIEIESDEVRNIALTLQRTQ